MTTSQPRDVGMLSHQLRMARSWASGSVLMMITSHIWRPPTADTGLHCAVGQSTRTVAALSEGANTMKRAAMGAYSRSLRLVVFVRHCDAKAIVCSMGAMSAPLGTGGWPQGVHAPDLV